MNTTTNSDCTLYTERQLAYSPAEIYQAFADPLQLARWWGPAGFTNTFSTFEFTNGGRWVFQMHAPDGNNYDNDSRFVELVTGEKVVIEHLCAPHFTLTVSLTANAQGTRLQWAQVFDDAATAAAVAKYAGAANEQNLDRLQRTLDDVHAG